MYIQTHIPHHDSAFHLQHQRIQVNQHLSSIHSTHISTIPLELMHRNIRYKYISNTNYTLTQTPSTSRFLSYS